MALKPTEEQQAARESFVRGRDLALVAGAGTGKTSTLILMGSAAPRKRGLYVSFNKEIAANAKGRFGPNVRCRTSHSLAFEQVGRPYKARLDQSAHLPSRETARRLNIFRDLDAGGKRISPAHQARLVMGMVRKFCQSAARTVSARHMDLLNGVNADAQAWVAEQLLPYALRAWEDICLPSGTLRFEHDHYLKMWALTEPQLRADFVLLDEAQDTNAVLEEIFLAQHAQRVCVGDPSQQIYAWRGAKDVMTGFPADHLYLTQSFRFGHVIAEQANRWLGHAGSDMRLTGTPERASTLAPLARPDVVLCRSNADAMREILEHLAAGVRPELWGGGKALQTIAEAARLLKDGKRTSHPELFLFDNWAEVQDYVDTDKTAGDLRTLVAVVDTYGPDTIIDAVNRLAPPGGGQLVISTAHKAKGREWSRVRISEGFDRPGRDQEDRQLPIRPDEARLAYVAVTRAMDVLAADGLSWIDDYENEIASQRPSPERRAAVLNQLSLTGQISNKDSPVTEFLRRHLPHPETVTRAYLGRLDRLPHPIQPTSVANPDWESLGHAIDYLLRLSLGHWPGQAFALGVGQFGAQRLDVVPGMLDEGPRAAVLAAGTQLLNAFTRRLNGSEHFTNEQLSRMCFVAAQYERVFRSGTLSQRSMLATATGATTLDGLLAAVPNYVIADLDQQMRLAAGPFAELRRLPAHRIVCGPSFAGSTDLGGADADFILGGLLLDCKATIAPRRIGVDEVYQLAGYLLLDYDDTFAMRAVGLYLSRQGGLITWTVHEFLSMLGATAPLPRLRQQFRAALQAAHFPPAAGTTPAAFTAPVARAAAAPPPRVDTAPPTNLGAPATYPAAWQPPVKCTRKTKKGVRCQRDAAEWPEYPGMPPRVVACHSHLDAREWQACQNARARRWKEQGSTWAPQRAGGESAVAEP